MLNNAAVLNNARHLHAKFTHHLAHQLTTTLAQLSWMLLTMPKSNCSFCRNLRYTLGALKYDKKTEQCKECLVDDFTTMVSNFKCPNDNGKCSKCCMDLTIIYLARFVVS